MQPKVFISIGTACSLLHAEASDTIFQALETAGLSPRQMGRNEWSSEQPLRAIKRVIEECEGGVVIAFCRYQFPAGVERKKDGGESPLSDVRLPTVWNQIEAAMAYTRNLPLLVIAEHGLRDDGLLEGRYDWKVFWTDFKPEHFWSKEFVGFLNSWKRLVDASAASRRQIEAAENDISKMSIGQLFAQLSVPQLWATLSAIVGLIIGAATVAFRAGAGKWPWS
jgi:hypothetical protein